MKRKQFWIPVSIAAFALIIALAAIAQTPAVKPVIVRDIDNINRSEIINTAAMPVFLNPGESIKEACFPDGPANKRIIVEHVSGRLIVPTGQSPRPVIHGVGTGSQYFIAVFQGPADDTRDIYAFSQQVHWVLPPSAHLCIQMDRYPTAGNATAAMTYIGRYIDYP